MQWRLLPISALSFPTPQLRPGGWSFLLTGVICASGFELVCWPIKIFEGNVYFLERIAPAACKPFWISPFMCKNLPLWGIVQDLSVTECWFGTLQRKWRSSRGSTDLAHAEPSKAIGEQPSTTLLSTSGILLHPNCHYRRLEVCYIAVSLQWRAESKWHHRTTPKKMWFCNIKFLWWQYLHTFEE